MSLGSQTPGMGDFRYGFNGKTMKSELGQPEPWNGNFWIRTYIIAKL